MCFKVGASSSLGEKPRPMLLVLGSETNGLSKEALSACNLIIRIPGVVDNMAPVPDDTESPLPTSLNVAAATAILLYRLKHLRS